jgi:hypothetical protein
MIVAVEGLLLVTIRVPDNPGTCASTGAAASEPAAASIGMRRRRIRRGSRVLADAVARRALGAIAVGQVVLSGTLGPRFTGMPDSLPPEERRERRRTWPVRVYRLGEEPGDDLSGITTPSERVEMVWDLSARAWELTGQPIPVYTRGQIPVRIIRPA